MCSLLYVTRVIVKRGSRIKRITDHARDFYFVATPITAPTCAACTFSLEMADNFEFEVDDTSQSRYVASTIIRFLYNLYNNNIVVIVVLFLCLRVAARVLEFV